MQAGEVLHCNQVIAEISSALRSESVSMLNAAIYRHLSTCSRCRAGLLLLAGAFDSEQNHRAAYQSCDRCQADLAAFIDLEAEVPFEAAAIYPHVWWHLWTCETCSQTYEFTHTLLDTQRSGTLAPLRLPKPVAPDRVPLVRQVRLNWKTLGFALTLLDTHLSSELAPLPLPESVAPDRLSLVRQVRLNRQLLGFALPNRMFATRALPGRDDRYVLFDETADEPEQRRFSIIAEEQGDGLWRVFATVVPPPDGLLLLTLGTLRFVAPFNPDGTASIDTIPSDVLLNPGGPDMEIGIAATNE